MRGRIGSRRLLVLFERNNVLESPIDKIGQQKRLKLDSTSHNTRHSNVDFNCKKACMYTTRQRQMQCWK